MADSLNDMSAVAVRSRPRVGKGRLAPLAILGLLAAIYLLENQILPAHLSGFASSYVLQPILWCILALGVLAVRRADREIPGPVRSLLWMGLLLGAFHIAIILIATLLTRSGFGESPYAHSIRYVSLNTLSFVATVAGLELSRAYLLRAFSKNHIIVVLLLVAVLYTFLMVPLVQLTNLREGFPFVDGNYLPLLAQNVLACCLALAGGPLASMGYWIVLRSFEWYSPILPNMPWILNAFAGTLAAIIGLLVLQSLYGEKIETVPEDLIDGRRKSNLTGWVAVSIACVALVFMTFGALGFRPLLVGSGSMSPALEVGDIAVVTPVSADTVVEGDIIQFVRGGATLVHRVVQVQEGDTRILITQGDANDGPDSHPVHPDQVQGKVRFRVPKLGWVAIGIKSLLS